MTDYREVREKFYTLARTQFPEAGEPGTCWVLTEVLGWDWDMISSVAVEGFDRKGYRVFITDQNGARATYTTSDGRVRVKTVSRKWTNEEKSKLRPWWWLLGF